MSVDYRVEIEFIPKNVDSNISTVNLPIGNNISGFNGGNYQNSDIETPNIGSNPFILGVSKLGNGETFSNYYDGYLSSVLADENGLCDFTMTINGSNLSDFTIYFDSIVNQHATEIIVNGETILNDDNQFTYVLEQPTSQIEVKFNKWNKADNNIRFTAISLGLTLSYDKFNGLLNMVRGSQSMRNNELPIYGALSQYGSVELMDKGNEIYDLEELGLLKSGSKVKFYVDNELQGDYLFDKFTKNESKHTYKIQLNDEIITWNKISIEEKSLEFDKTALDFYNFLKEQYTFAEYEELSQEMQEYLSSIKIKYFYLNSGTLFAQWNKFCDITQCQVYKKPNGKINIRKFN